MGSTSFSSSCKEALTSALARKGRKYNLQHELRQACNADVQRLCPGLSQETQQADVAAAKTAHRQRSLQQQTGAAAGAAAEASSDSSKSSGDASSTASDELVCLSKHLSELSPGCRQEVAAEVHRELMVYMPGMPLTAACDGDAKKMCNAGG
jgi:hypothetical protein